MKEFNKKSKENIFCFLVIIIVLILTIISVCFISKKLSKSEQKLYEIIENNKTTFKDPRSLKVISAKICSSDYSIIKITANNSYGAATTETYYLNKNTLMTDKYVAKIVAKKCFNEQLNNYDKVIVLSKKSIDKVNKLLRGE